MSIIEKKCGDCDFFGKQYKPIDGAYPGSPCMNPAIPEDTSLPSNPHKRVRYKESNPITQTCFSVRTTSTTNSQGERG